MSCCGGCGFMLSEIFDFARLYKYLTLFCEYIRPDCWKCNGKFFPLQVPVASM